MRNALLAVTCAFALSGCSCRDNVGRYKFVDRDTGAAIQADVAPMWRNAGRETWEENGIMVTYDEDGALRIFWRGSKPMSWGIEADGYELTVIEFTPGEHTVPMTPKPQPTDKALDER